MTGFNTLLPDVIEHSRRFTVTCRKGEKCYAEKHYCYSSGIDIIVLLL